MSILSVVITLTASISFAGQWLLNDTMGLITAIVVSATIAGVSASMMLMNSRRLSKVRERRRVFLIYAREDVDFARDLARVLRENGFTPWLDVDEITAGQVWQKAVIRALEESAVALVLISPHLDKAGFVQEELKIALDTLQGSEKDISPIIPVRLEDKTEVPERLAQVQWVNLFEDSGMRYLLEGLHRITKSN